LEGGVIGDSRFKLQITTSIEDEKRGITEVVSGRESHNPRRD
jgi:hypothetical protein